MHYVYIIQSKSNSSYYYGFTNNLKQRLLDHNKGKVTYTSKHKPYRLIWFCVFSNKNLAINFEKYLKSSSGHAFMKKRFL